MEANDIVIVNQNRVINLARAMLISALGSVYLFLWINGAAYHLIVGRENAEQNRFSSLGLFLAGLIVLAGVRARRDLPKLIAVGLLGFWIEVFAVRYGIPFGSYRYTHVLKPHLLEVPLVMGFAWMVLVAYVKQMLLCIKLKVWVELLLAAGWMTAIDLLIDPSAATSLAYWQWAGGGRYYGVPAINFMGWFLSSLALFLIFRAKWKSNRCARVMGISIVALYTCIAFGHGLFLPASIGCALCLIHVVVTAQHRERIAHLLQMLPSSGARYRALRRTSNRWSSIPMKNTGDAERV